MDLTRAVDPKGKRTIGVLTKPDRIEDNCHQLWLDILHGTRLPLELGYFVVRNPTQVRSFRQCSSSIGWLGVMKVGILASAASSCFIHGLGQRLQRSLCPPAVPQPAQGSCLRLLFSMFLLPSPEACQGKWVSPHHKPVCLKETKVLACLVSLQNLYTVHLFYRRARGDYEANCVPNLQT